MTVATTITKASYTGNGVTVAFALAAYCQTSDQVAVYANGVLVSTGAYAVTGLRAVGGVTVTFVTAPAVGVAIVVKRILPLTQGVNTVNNETILQDVFDDALDRGVMRDQQLQTNITDGDAALQILVDRTVRVPAGEAGFDLEPVATRAGKVAIFDAFGKIIAGVLAVTTVAFGAFGQAMAATATAEDAATLGGTVKYFNVKTYGAIPGTVSAGQRTLNRAAIQAAFNAAGAATDASVKVVKFPGRFEVDAMITNPNNYVAQEGCGGYADGLDYKGGQTTNPLLYVTGDWCPTRRMRFFGVEWTTYVGRVSADWDDTIWPGTLLRYGNLVVPINGVEVEDCKFRGGTDGLGIWIGNDVSVKGVRVNKAYRNGMFTSSGCKRVVVHDYRAYDAGINEGYKFGFGSSGQLAEEVIIDNFAIVNCGKLDTDTAFHQEGLDAFVADMIRVKISNGFITGCGNGGIEFKTQHSTHVGAVDVFEQIEVSNVTVNVIDLVDTGQPAFALNWTVGTVDPLLPPTKGRRFKFTDCKAYYFPAPSSSSGSAWQILAFDEVEIVNATVRGCDVFVRTSGEGGTDLLINNLKITGGDIEVVGWGLYHGNGGINGVEIDGGNWRCGKACIILGSGTGSLAVTSLTLRGGVKMVTSSTSVNDPCVQLPFAANVVMESDVYLEAEYRGIAVPASTPASTGGRIAARIKVRNSDPAPSQILGAGFNATEGTWDLNGMRYDGPTADSRAWFNNGTATINGGGVKRGQSADPTLWGGAVGEWVDRTAPTAAGALGWACTGAADNSATWKAVVLAA